MFNQKIICWILISFSFITFTFTACSKKKEEAKAPAPTVANAAIVNGNPITTDDLQREMTRIKQRFYDKGQMSEQQIKQVEQEILEILIRGELLFQASKTLGISPTNEEVEAELERAKQTFPDTGQFKNTFSTDEMYKKLAIEKYIAQEFAAKTLISDETAKEYYDANIDDFTQSEKIMASHILIKADDKASPEDGQSALERINDIARRLRNGEDFAELAQQYNEDKSTPPSGMLGYLVRGQMPIPFEEAAFATNVNEVSDVFETEYGYHIVKIHENKPMHIIPYEEIKDKLINFLRQQEIQKKLEEFIKEQRAKAEITILNESWTQTNG